MVSHTHCTTTGWGHPTVEIEQQKNPSYEGAFHSTAESLNVQPQIKSIVEFAEPQEWTHSSQVEGEAGALRSCITSIEVGAVQHISPGVETWP